jgi:hypothetical protein
MAVIASIFQIWSILQILQASEEHPARLAIEIATSTKHVI